MGVSGLLWPPAYLDEPLVGPDKLKGRRPRAGQDFLETRVRGVAAGDPNDLRGRAMHPNEIDEVPILGQDNGSSTPCRKEDLRILPIAQSKILERRCLYA